MTASSKVPSVKSAERVLDILELLGRTGRALTHAEIARRTGIPKSSLTSLLANLARRGYVCEVGGAGTFRLGEAAFDFARRGARVRSLIAVAKPVLERLTAVTGESSGLSLLYEDMAERVCSADSSRAVRYAMHVGVRAPLYANSGGKVFLAWMTAQEREAYLQRVKLLPVTDRTIRSVAGLRRQLQEIRSEGVAYSFGEFTPGIVGMAVPVLDVHGRVHASLGVALPAERFDESSKQRLLNALRASARAIVESLQEHGELLPP